MPTAHRPAARTAAVPDTASSARRRQRLRQGRVLIVGLGGLGSPCALALTRAGIGTLGLLDCDAVELSNLQRQILYRSDDIGRRKVIAAAERLTAIAPSVTLRIFDQRLGPANALDLFRDFDFVVDGTDGITSKYLINDAAVLAGVPFSHAGIVGFQGQAMTVLPRRSACLRCVFPEPPLEGDVPTCHGAGIIGALAGSMGLVQAIEATKYLLGAETVLANRLLTCDAETGRWRNITLPRNPGCPLCGERPVIHALELVAADPPVAI